MYRRRYFRVSVIVLLSIGICYYWITRKVDYENVNNAIDFWNHWWAGGTFPLKSTTKMTIYQPYRSESFLETHTNFRQVCFQCPFTVTSVKMTMQDCLSHIAICVQSYRRQEHTKARFNDSGFLEVGQRLAERKRRMTDVCAKLGYGKALPGDAIYKKNKYLSKSLFYTDKWKILMCLIPKCASRSQATFLGTCEGFGNEAIKHAYKIAEKYLSPRTAKHIGDVALRINEYTKIVVAREPFSRLLSAYRDKIESGGRGANYVQKYRAIKRGKKNKNETISYADFVEYLVNSKGDPQLDPHWNYYERLCSPCEIDYAYVVHLDTLEEDVKYITSKLGMRNYTFPPSFNAFTDFEKVKRYYNQVPSSLTDKLYKKYKSDFDIFGFPPPRF